jgi:signal transduction histidine kinase
LPEIIYLNRFRDSEIYSNNVQETFDVILMDIMMPVMDGLTASKKIRAMERPDAKTIPIIAMTANAFKEDAERCIIAGMNANLAKPLEIDKIISAIHENLI